jgi:hypothetical protein
MLEAVVEVRLRQFGAVVVAGVLVAVLVGVGAWIVQIGEGQGAAVRIGAIVAFVAGGAAALLAFTSKRFGPRPLGSQVREAKGWKSLVIPVGGVAIAWALAAISGASRMVVLSFLLGLMLVAFAFIVERVVRNPGRWSGSGSA